jgi:uncharacterized protein YdaU (DUF1376 family)
MDYYRRFPGDYGRDTRHLTLEEHGAYTLLLDHCYSTERPIISLEAAYKVCAAMSKRERNSVKKVLEEFFELSRAGYSNSRVKKEINYAESISEKRRYAAQVKHTKYANAEHMHSKKGPIPDNQTIRQPDPVASAMSGEGFEVENSHSFSSNGNRAKATRKGGVSSAWEKLRIPKVKP